MSQRAGVVVVVSAGFPALGACAVLDDGWEGRISGANPGAVVCGGTMLGIRPDGIRPDGIGSVGYGVSVGPVGVVVDGVVADGVVVLGTSVRVVVDVVSGSSVVAQLGSCSCPSGEVGDDTATEVTTDVVW